MKILMVCLGNICRSPLADGLMRNKIKKLNLSAEVDSAGTGDWHVGQAPDKRMQKTAKDHQIDISQLRGRQFHPNDFETFDKIYVMDQSNYNNVTKLAKNDTQLNKVDFILNEISPGSNAEVPDPYFGGDEGFKEVYRLLDQATDQIIEKYLKN